MPYKLIKFDSENVIVDGKDKRVFVALIEKEGEEQPFRVSIENIEDKKMALKQVKRWIAEAELTDENRVLEKEVEEKTAAEDESLTQLNASLEEENQA